MAEFILKDWYGKEHTFDKETIYVRGKDGDLLPFTYGTGDPGESPEMIYYRGLAHALMTRNAEHFSGDATKMNMKGFVTASGSTLASLNSYSFAGFKNVKGMSFSDVILVYENAFVGCDVLKVIDITVAKTAPQTGALPGGLNGCPNLEAFIVRESENGLERVVINKNHGSNDDFYIYVPSAYYEAVTANLPDTALPKSRYRKLEDYPEIDHWNETNT